MPEPHVFIEHVITPEGTLSVAQCFFRDETGAVMGASELTSLVATLYDKEDPSLIVTNWDERDVRGVGGGTFDATTKKFTLRIPPTANERLQSTSKREIRILLLEYSWGTDGKGVFEAQYPIDDLVHVP